MSARMPRVSLAVLVGVLFLITNGSTRTEEPRDPVQQAKPPAQPAKSAETTFGSTAEERKLLAALNTYLSIDLNDSTLKAVIDYLQEKTGVPIIVPQSILDEKKLKYNAPVSVSLKNAPMRTILKKTLSGLDPDLTCVIKDGVIQVTTEERVKKMLSTRRYFIGDLVAQMPLLLPRLKKDAPDIYQDIQPTDGLALLMRALLDAVELQSDETIEIRNKNQLAVLACPPRHEEIAELLSALRRFTDAAVVMNARLYEVDRAFFNKQIAPLFAGEKDADERRGLVAIEAPLLKAIGKQKLLLESEQLKLRPTHDATFLSLQSVFRFSAGPHPTKEGRTLTGTGLAGVSFEVRPFVSLDRRYLRLQISQKIVQLVGIDKTKKRDVFTGKEVDVEAPNVRKATLSETIQIPDMAPILMPVDYRPLGKGSDDKVWLLVARPFIWIEEEQRERGKPTPQASLWDAEVPKDETPAPVTPLPSDKDTLAILQAVLTDVLTSTDSGLKSTRDFYGTAKDKTFTLIDDKLGWPKKFHPETHGFKQVTVRLDPFVDQRRVLGIRLDKFDLKQKKSDKVDETRIEICVLNAGGNANGGAGGGCFIYYRPKYVKNRWTVECLQLFSP